MPRSTRSVIGLNRDAVHNGFRALASRPGRMLFRLLVLAVALPVAGCVDTQPGMNAPSGGPGAATSGHHAVTVTDASFQSQVLASPKLVLVDIWASWCGPCVQMEPAIEEIAVAYEGQVVVAKVNADENPGVIGQYEVTALPTLLFIRDGRLLQQVKGYHAKQQLAAKLDALLASGE